MKMIFPERFKESVNSNTINDNTPMIFPERFKESVKSNTINDNTPHAQHTEENIHEMCALVDSSKMMSPQEEDRGIMNAFTGQLATVEQTKDVVIQAGRNTG